MQLADDTNRLATHRQARGTPCQHPELLDRSELERDGERDPQLVERSLRVEEVELPLCRTPPAIEGAAAHRSDGELSLLRKHVRTA